MGWYGNDGFDGQMHWFGWVMMAGWIMLVVVAVVAGIYFLARSRRPADMRSEPGARQVLDTRFARGEIDVDEYQLRRAVLADTTRS
jgi:putative membrane protein